MILKVFIANSLVELGIQYLGIYRSTISKDPAQNIQSIKSRFLQLCKKLGPHEIKIT